MLSTYPDNGDCSGMRYMEHLGEISDDPAYGHKLITQRLSGKSGTQIIDEYKNNKCIAEINKNAANLDKETK